MKELVFSVQGDLAQQLEITVLNIAGALTSIGVSALALYCSSLLPYDSAVSRAIPAVFLVMVASLAGWLKSKLPRLNLSTRIAMFVAIFMMTDHIGIRSKVLPVAGNYLWIVLCAAVIPLVCSMLVLEWSSARFARDLASVFVDLHNSLESVLARAFNEQSPRKYDHTAMQALLLKKSVALNATYQQVSFELRLGRLSLKTVKPLIAVVEHVRRELAWGMSFDRVTSSEATNSENQTMDAFREPAQDLGNAILQAMKVTEQAVNTAYQHSLLWHPTPLDIQLVETAMQKLQHAQTVARIQLRTISDAIDVEQRMSTESDVNLSRDLFDICLFMASLLQMSREMKLALSVSHRMTTMFANSRARLWLPRLSRAWLGAPPSNYMNDDLSALINQEEEDAKNEADTNLSVIEAQQGLSENGYDIRGYRQRIASDSLTSYTLNLDTISRPRSGEWSLSHIPYWIYRFWSSRLLMKLRFTVSKIIRAIQHSSHLKHALKNAVGISLLSLPAFLGNESAGKKWFSHIHGQWMVISYMWILETNTGATWRSGYLRLFGTISGAVYAYITWLVCRRNPYGLVALITLSDVPITWLILNTSIPPLGIVAAITLPPVALLQYIDPDAGRSVITIAVDRGLLIGAGIIAALLMNGFVFPRHCRVLFLSNAGRTLNLLNQMYMSLSRDTIRGGHVWAPQDRRTALKQELSIRSALHRMSLLLVTMNDELSLLPKPIRHYQRMILTLQKTLDLLTGLRKVREHIPRKETVADVFRERRELMSCVCMALYACENAFRLRQPLPQFIPSARHAFNTLQIHVAERIREARERDKDAIGLSLVYAFAESEVMRDLIDSVEDLLQLSRELFGSAAWLTETPGYVTPVTTAPGTPISEEETMGWYSTIKGLDDA